MGFSTAELLVSLLVGSVGLVLFLYGKKQRRIPQVVAGLVLMVYPYFVDGALTMALIGAAVVAALWLALRRGL